MKTKVQTHEGVDIYRVESRGRTHYKSDPVYGEPLTGDKIDEVVKKITAKHAVGDTRVQVQVHEGVNIYQVKDGSGVHFISDPVVGEVIVGNSIDEVTRGITMRRFILGI